MASLVIVLGFDHEDEEDCENEEDAGKAGPNKTLNGVLKSSTGIL